jgi:hypothetical protein
MFKSLLLLGVINSSLGVPFIFFNRKRAPPIFHNNFCNKTKYIKVPVYRNNNNSLLITLIMHDLCFVYPDMIKYVYKKDKLA